MKKFNDIKENQKGFGEEDRPLQGKDIANLYEDYFEFVSLLKRIFKE